MNNSVIVVSVNSRLAALGFLALEVLATEDTRRVSGNYAILDQQLAMRWGCALGPARDRALRRRPQSRISPWAGAAGPISIALCCAAVLKREASSSSTAAAQQAASAAATKEETGGGGGSGGPAPPPEPDYLRHAPPLCSLYRP